jgi:pentatricopeptide repeat protein
MAMKVANFRLLICTITMMKLLITQSYLLPCYRTSRMRLMSEKAPGAIVNERKQFDFKELIERCSQNAVYTPAVKAAAEYLRSSETLSQSGVNSVIKIYGLAAMVDDAIDALSYAESRGIILNVRHYNAVISVCGKHKRYDDAVVVYERFLEACRSRLVPSMSPDIVTRNNMIGILGDKGDWKRALEIFREVSPSERDSILYTTILRAFQKNNRPSEALEVFGEMFSTRKKNDTKNNQNNQNNQNIQNAEQNTPNSPNTVSVCPTVQMYTSLISTFGKDGDWERSWGIFQNMQKPDGEFPALIPDKVLVLTMVRILEKAGQLDKAALVKQNSLRHSQQHSLPGQGSSTPPKFNDLIREGKRSGDFRAAVAAADEWIAMKKYVD